MKNLIKFSENLLIRHEGLELKPYKCTSNKITIGIGRNLEDKGISKEEALILLENDIKEHIVFLEKLSFWDSLSDIRKSVLIDMVHNLGQTGFLGFKKMLKAISENNFTLAKKEMLNSKWAMQVGNRAYELADIIENNKFII
jgi:lysozyme